MKSILVVTVLYIVAGGTGGDAKCDYSEQACKNVGALMGRTFKRGSYATKGCYLYYYKKYGGNIYYGTGGSETKRNSNLPRSWTKKRPPGFDCNRVNFLAQSEKTECNLKMRRAKIVIEKKCKDAAQELGLKFAKTDEWTDKPGGCFHNWGINIEGRWGNCARGNTCAYFNTKIESTGNTSPPICETEFYSRD